MKRFLILALAIALPLQIFAQNTSAPSGPYAIIEFVKGKQLTITTPDGMVMELKNNPSLSDGTEKLYAGTQIETKDGTQIELRLYPNKSIVKLSANTNFKVNALAGDKGQDKTSLAVLGGKIRMIAAKGTADAKYEIRSQSTVCGVRGTDFVFSSLPGDESLIVKEGLVEFDKLGTNGLALGKALQVGAGEGINAFKEFAKFTLSPDQLKETFSDMVFDKLKETEVPGQTVSKTEEKQSEEKKTEDKKVTETTSSGMDSGNLAGTDSTEDKTRVATSEESAQAGAQVDNAIVKWLKEAMGMEIGTISIGDKNYSKAVLQPTIILGKFKTALYLPIIYSSNMFDPNDWYKPLGNNEWSFGTEYWSTGDYLKASLDTLSDLALKIKSLELGDPLIDDFSIKVGNLNNFTIGHGLIMNNYANDSDFPSIRRIGLYLKSDMKSWGFELMGNDLSDIQITGGRLFIRPIEGFNLAFGVSSIIDWNPSSEMTEVAANANGKPIFIGAGLDLELPVVKSDLVSAVLFADAAGMIPYTQTALGTVAAGPQFGLIVDSASSSLKNLGASTGILGNILFVKYRLEYRYYTGMFKASFFDKGYDRNKSTIVTNYAAYMTDATVVAQKPSVMGVYGEAGFNLLNDKLVFTAGYQWPWVLGGTIEQQLAAGKNDFLHAQVSVKKGLIPVLDLSGSISYDRTNFVNTLINNSDATVTLFDENTVFKGELVTPVPNAPNIDIAVLFSTATLRNADGTVSLIPNTNRPEIVPVIGIETRVHF